MMVMRMTFTDMKNAAINLLSKRSRLVKEHLYPIISSLNRNYINICYTYIDTY